MRVFVAAFLCVLGFAAAAGAEDVPTTPVTTTAPPPTTTVATTTAPAPPPPTTSTTTTVATTTTTPATTTAPRPATTTAPRIAVPAEISGSYDVPEIVPVPAHVEGVLRTLGLPLRVTPPLAAGPYVFPVAGESSWSDTYGGPRSDVPGGWHHGDDIFARLGQPVLAVADGHVYKIGWQRLGGWRLWLKDGEGNRFYYAHLSGYAPVAKNQAEVKAGDVLGYIGHTGDAFTTPFHLHFEIHPVSLLWLKYNGAVNPSSYLESWPHETKPAPLPAPLPLGAAQHGEGALSDYRQLLSLFRTPAEKRTAGAPPEASAAAGPVGSQQLAAARATPGPSRWPVVALSAAAAILLNGALFLAGRLRGSR